MPDLFSTPAPAASRSRPSRGHGHVPVTDVPGAGMEAPAPPELSALRKFVEGSGEAFAAVTERYTGLVHSAAWRRTGSHELAQEVAQNVFSILARKAPRLLRENAPLAAWLHRAAVLEAAQANRREQARRRMMKAYHASYEAIAHDPSAPSALGGLLPDLDEGLNQLPGPDRELLLGRYFEDRSYRELAAATGRSEAALMQQHHRALEKLARYFKRRGHTVTAAALAAGLSAPFSGTAPAGLSAICAAGATASATVAGTGVSGALQLAFAMQIKTHFMTTAAILCLLAGTAAFYTGRWQRDRAIHERGALNPSVPATSAPGVVSADRNPGGLEVNPSPTPTGLPILIPTAAEVLAAEGRERVEKLALWLTEAQPDALDDMLEKIAAGEETNTQQKEKELILQRWVEVAPRGAFAANRKMEGNTWIAGAAWGRLDPKAAWAAAGKLDDFEKTHVLKGIIGADPGLAAEILSSATALGNPHRSDLQGLLAAGLSKKDPVRGWELALNTGAWMRQGKALQEWIGEDPDAAISFALGRPGASQRLEAMQTLMTALKERHPDKIPPLLASLPEGRLKWRLSGLRASMLSGTDPEAAMDLAQSPSASPMARAAMTESLAEAWVDSKPEKVLELLRGLDWSLSGGEAANPGIMTASTPASDPEKSKAAEALRNLAGHGHLAAALSVAESVPPGPGQDQALSAVAGGWPAARIMELSEWLSGQPSPAVREAGARNIVEHLIAEKEPDFEAAASWAATLPVRGDPENSELVEIMRKWRETDADAATALMKTLTVPDGVRAIIEKPAKP